MSTPFYDIPQSEWIAQNRSGFAVRDLHPVSPGHSLVIPRRLISTWWEASVDEQADLMQLAVEVKNHLDVEFRPDGYNVGFNSGDAAGQTIDHLHLHLIPRWYGDVADPRGGIRGVLGDARWNGMPALAGEAAEAADNRRLARARLVNLVDGPSRSMQAELLDHLGNEGFDRIDLLVSFVLLSGLDLIGGGLEDALDRGARVRVLTTDYLGITEPGAFGWLLDRATDGTLTGRGQGGLEAKVFSDPTTSFHPKAYLFWSERGVAGAAFVGSSNVSRSGLSGGIEWNLRTDEVQLMRVGFDHLWNDQRAVPLSEQWLQTYHPTARTRAKQVATSGAVPELQPAPDADVAADDLDQPEPTTIQREALDALEATRDAGFRAGLVVMATGLGKTWLAAFDSTRPAVRRVLFVAHREEILLQSRDVFRRVRPEGSFGLFISQERHPNADVVFASIQSLARNLDMFDRDEFDYLVIDEFHHAAAQSYRKVLDHFRPSFMLGLTATPQRMDGADLLGLCNDNLVFECGLVEGIDRSHLVPFRYWGVPDIVDFEPIPWRNGRFDPDALTTAVATIERAEHALREWSTRKGSRTLAFCASTLHADFMAGQFNAAGIRSAAVHSKDTSAPRSASLRALLEGDLEVLFSVDVFNEGVDLPAVDTVLMLRPTESPVVFMQQLGRGLRHSDGKDHLRVIDFIGNHRSFLSKPRTLLSLGSTTTPTTKQTLDALRSGDFELPAGCSVDYDLAAVEILERMRPPASASDLLVDFARSYTDEEGLRPTATQAWKSGYDPNQTLKQTGWFQFLKSSGLLGNGELRVLERHGQFLHAIERTPITKSYKFVTLRALLHEGGIRTGVPVNELADASQRLIAGDPRLIRDATSEEIPSPADTPSEQWRRYWRRWPIAAWLGELINRPSEWFSLDGDRFGVSFAIAEEDEDLLAVLVAELVEYRLARYLVDQAPGTTNHSAEMVCRVSHEGGRPLLLLDRRNNANIPTGTVPFRAGDNWYQGDFRKDALKVARLSNEPGNALHALLRGWFGPSAGHPGTRFTVSLTDEGGQLVMAPASGRAELTEVQTLPLFPTLEVACGAFDSPSDTVHKAGTFELRLDSDTVLDRDRQFIAFARGDSMDGGGEPIRHGDPLLFEWARGVDRTDLVGKRVLVEYRNGGFATALKRLTRDQGRFTLQSDNPSVPPIDGIKEMQVIARLDRRLTQRDINPLDPHIGETHPRKQIMALHGDPEGRTNWQQGHVSLPGQAVLIVTLDKAEMSGVHYVDHFEGRSRMIWSSQASTSPEMKKGREILNALETGTQLHLWVRPRKKDNTFTYCGLVVPLSHEGSKPMAVTFRLLTALDTEVAHRLGVD